jgi:cytochrome c553
MKRWVEFGGLLLLAAAMATARAETPQPRGKGIESPDYVWNEMQGEKLLALRAKGDALRGEIAFEVCQGCHRNKALGREDGKYPRLAGQHASVLIKQMTDVRAGRRDNSRMYPFANEHVLGPQDIADVAVYLQGLPVNADNGKGPGAGLPRGKALYLKDCATCHGEKGEGHGPGFQPRLSGQHYRYLLHEGRAIRDGQRRNADPKMVGVIKEYGDADLEAVLDYASRLPVTGG